MFTMEELEEDFINRNLTCILFPGVVQNEDNAIECLGGIRNISKVCSNSSKKRLGLSFKPGNPYVKNIFADVKKTAGVLVKVKVKKKMVDNEVKREVVSTSVMGRIKQVYNFVSMCDFQYLPVATDVQPPRCILEQIIPSGVDNVDFIKKSVPNFIVPSSFLRSDKPVNYAYTDKKNADETNISTDEDNIHYRIREDRGLPGVRHTFNLTDDLPKEPDNFYVEQMKAKASAYPVLEKEYEIVKKLFEERPIWSTNALKYNTKIKHASLRVILPCLAIYFKNGPWRISWVRFGYDPRKNPEARIYQCLDFRLRQDGGINSLVTRESDPSYKKIDRVKAITKKEFNDGTSVEDVVHEGAVYFRPGMAPTQRQIFYQYCDVKLPEVEALVGAGAGAGAGAAGGAGALCHAARGWLAPGVADLCRDHIFTYAKRTLLATHNTDFKYEVASDSEDDQSSEREADVSMITDE